MLLPDCSHSTLPMLLSVVPSHRFVAPPPRSLCLFSLCRDTEQAGPKSLSQGKGADSLKRHREGFKRSQALREALLAAKPAHS